MRAFRDDKVTLNQMQALAVADDHGVSRRCDAPEHLLDSRNLRWMVVQSVST
jgi:hypothetical protein